MSVETRVRCLVLGGGGHARVVIDSLLAQDAASVEGVLDADHSLWGTSVLGVPVLGDEALLPDMARRGITHFLVGLGGAADNRARSRLFEMGRGAGLTALNVCHPSAVCSSFARIGAGSMLLPCAIVNAGAELGMNVIVNTGAVVEHDCTIGDHAHVATGARLSGGVQVGKLAHVGVGACVRQELTIGEGAIIGAGAAVVKDVAPWTVVVGVPARLFRRVKPGGDTCSSCTTSPSLFR